MAVKTMKMSSGISYDIGWHELTISSAKYDTWVSRDGKEKRVIDLNFEGYPEKRRLRMFAVNNKETGEEFKIANLFRFANAGILGVLKDPTGKKPVIQYDDEAENLIGKRINVFFYKEQKTGNEYIQMFDTVAPVEQEGEHVSWTSEQVASLKVSAEKNYHKLHGNTTATNNLLEDPSVVSTSSTDDIPF
tara:strand:- start:285 stop:854 length:570 start_codon:yes stop_codon:yes gene_type:complete